MEMLGVHARQNEQWFKKATQCTIVNDLDGPISKECDKAMTLLPWYDAHGVCNDDGMRNRRLHERCGAAL